MKDKLFLFTSSYPYGTAESFVENELLVLSSFYKEIHIFPLILKKELAKRNLPANTIIHDPYKVGRTSVFSIGFKVISVVLTEFFKCSKKINFLKNLRVNLRTLLQCDGRAKKMIDLKSQFENADLYCFWMEDWATTLALLKMWGWKINFISRVHGYDLYNERHSGGFIPWRHFQLKKVAKVIAVSKDGKDYLTKHYPFYSNKIFVSYLGITGVHPIGRIPSGPVFRIVSCSNLVAIKRVNLLAILLQKINFRVEWIHFGTGPEEITVRNATRQMNSDKVKINFRGYVPQQEIIEFYEREAIDLFVHLSESEGGVPIAIQEAVSFGIPVLACDAGGVREIVNGVTGKLLPINFSEAAFFEALNELKESACRNNNFRNSTKLFWSNNFDLKKSTEKFVSFF